MDGFDHYSVNKEARKWDIDFSASRDLNNPRTGIGHARLNVNSEYFGKLLTPTLGFIVVGFAIAIDGTLQAATHQYLLRLMSNTSNFQLGITYSETAKVFRMDNGSASTSESSVIDLSLGYVHLEMKATFDNGTPANNTVELRINGVSEISQTLDTNPQATDDINELRLEGITNGTDLDVDDFYILNSTSPNNDFLGDVKIVTLYPDADGGLTAWTGSDSPDWQQVDDQSGTIPDDNTTNIVSSTNGQQSIFSMDALTGVGAVKGLQISAATRKDGAGDGDIKILTSPDNGATLHKSATLTVGADASLHPFLMQQQDVDPDTAVAWIVADVNTAEFGVEQVS